MSYIALIISLVIVAIVINSGEYILDELRRYRTVGSLGQFLNKILGKGIAYVVIGVPIVFFLLMAVVLAKIFIFDN